jgi:hypothetical protein
MPPLTVRACECVGLIGQRGRDRNSLGSKISFREVNRAKHMAATPRRGAVGDDFLEQRHGFCNPTQAQPSAPERRPECSPPARRLGLWLKERAGSSQAAASPNRSSRRCTRPRPRCANRSGSGCSESRDAEIAAEACACASSNRPNSAEHHASHIRARQEVVTSAGPSGEPSTRRSPKSIAAL